MSTVEGEPCAISSIHDGTPQLVASAYYLDVLVADAPCRALLDTGASVSLMTEDLLHRIPNWNQRLRPPTVERLTGVDGGDLLVVGEVNISLKLGSFWSVPQRILVTHDFVANSELILGLDFVHLNKGIIDSINQRIVFAGRRRSISVPLHVEYQTCITYDVVCSAETVIAPRSRCLVPALVLNAPSEITGCMEPCYAEDSPLLFARSINTVQHGKSFVECTNFTHRAVVLEAGQKLSTLEPLEESALCSVVKATEADSPVGSSASDPSVASLFDLDSTILSEQEKTRVMEFLGRYKHVIGTSEYDMGCTETVRHKIDVNGAPPIKQRYRRLAPPIRKEVADEIEILLHKDIIEPSQSAWAAPLVPIRKKNGRLRICVDYRALNAVTKKDSFPLPYISDAVSQFNNNKYFSTLDLLAGYHQIAMDESSKEMTAFSTGDGLYQYTRMPFGITNGPASFSRLMSIVLSGLPIDVAQAYLDDILVAGSDFDDHLNNLASVFDRLAKHGLKLSADKCELFRTEVKYLGFLVSAEGLKPSPENLQAIIDFPKPLTIRKLKSFNGLVNFYKKFIPNSAEMMKPLYKATTGKKLNWTEDCEIAFKAAKHALVTAPVLAHPDFSDSAVFYVTCDASNTGVGAVLSQKVDGQDRPIAYAGTSLNAAQTRYSVTDKELVAIRFGVNHFKPFLYGRRFIIRTDHQPLIYLNHMKRVDDRLFRTFEDLNIGHYELEYLPGKSNTVADILSRVSYPWCMVDDSDSRFIPDDYFARQSYETLPVPGGANSLFEALSICVYGYDSAAAHFRQISVEAWIADPLRYGRRNDAITRKRMSACLSPTVFPPFELLQVFADITAHDVMVHFVDGPVFQVVGNYPDEEFKGRLHLRCSGGIHFDAMKETPSDTPTTPPLTEVVQNPCCLVQVYQPDYNIPESARLTEVLCRPKWFDEPLTLDSAPQVISPHEARLMALHPVQNDLVPRQVEDLVIGSSPAAIRFHQQQDDALVAVSNALRDDSMHQLPRSFRRFDGLLLNEHGVVCSRHPITEHCVPVAPELQLRSVANSLHEILNHGGRDKMRKVMSNYYWHPKLRAVISRTVQECPVCQVHKGSGGHGYPVHRRNPEQPYDLYSVDLMDLPRSRSGFKCLLVGVDAHSKFAHAVPLRNKTSNTVARALESHILASVPRTPKIILSDSGPEFRGAAFRNLLQTYNIEHQRSIPYAPHSNGGVERMNRTIKSKLSTACSDDTAKWDQVIFQIVAQYNRTPHSETGKAPCEFFTNYAELIIPKKPELWKPAKANFRPFQIGDLVLKKREYQKPGEADKLACKFLGPLRVIKVYAGDTMYQLRWLDGRKSTITAHFSQIKKYYGPCPDPIVPVPVNLPDTSESAAIPETATLQPSPIEQLASLPWSEIVHETAAEEFSQVNCADSAVLSREQNSVLPSNLNDSIGDWNIDDSQDVELEPLAHGASTPPADRPVDAPVVPPIEIMPEIVPEASLESADNLTLEPEQSSLDRSSADPRDVLALPVSPESSTLESLPSPVPTYRYHTRSRGPVVPATSTESNPCPYSLRSRKPKDSDQSSSVLRDDSIDDVGDEEIMCYLLGDISSRSSLSPDFVAQSVQRNLLDSSQEDV